MHRRSLLILTIAIAGAVHATASLAQSPIGSASSVQNQVQGIIGSGTQSIAAGGSVFQNERVRTGDDGQAQLVFLDQTNLGVGPKSDVTLNRFVYNPDRGTGRVAIEASRGVFRFVTGTQDPKNYSVKTPIATIEVRGTEFHLLVARNYIVVALVHGALRITTIGGRVVWLTEPGTTVTIYADGRVVGPSPWTGPFTKYAGDIPFPYFASGFGGLFPSFGGVLGAPTSVAGYGWNGCYVGGNTGGAWAHESTYATYTPTGPHDAGSLTTDGWVYGGQVGCDYQINNYWVVGIRGMWDGANIRGSNPWPAPFAFISNHYNIDSFGTAVGKLGYLLNPTLELYGLGGPAWVRDSLSFVASPTGEFATGSQTRTGYTAGVGLSWMFAPNWDLWVEYNYMGFGTKNINLPGVGTGAGIPYTADIKQNVENALVGIDYRFHLGNAR
jgi:opacity protein-like surface antigen